MKSINHKRVCIAAEIIKLENSKLLYIIAFAFSFSYSFNVNIEIVSMIKQGNETILHSCSLIVLFL